MNTKNKFLLTNFFLFLICINSMAQKLKTSSLGESLTEFLSSKKVINNFKHLKGNQQDSLITFIDLNNIANVDPIKTWKGSKITFLNNGPLVDSLKLLDAHFLLKGRCNYYILMSKKASTKVTQITLRHACTNVVSNIKITEKNRQFYLGKIENGVW